MQTGGQRLNGPETGDEECRREVLGAVLWLTGFLGGQTSLMMCLSSLGRLGGDAAQNQPVGGWTLQLRLLWLVSYALGLQGTAYEVQL